MVKCLRCNREYTHIKNLDSICLLCREEETKRPYQQPQQWQETKIRIGGFSLITELNGLLEAIAQKWKQS